MYHCRDAPDRIVRTAMAAALIAEQAGETIPGLHPGRFSDSAERDSALPDRDDGRKFGTFPLAKQMEDIGDRLLSFTPAALGEQLSTICSRLREVAYGRRGQSVFTTAHSARRRVSTGALVSPRHHR